MDIARQQPRPRIGDLVVFDPGPDGSGDVLGSVAGFPARLPHHQRIPNEPIGRAYTIVLDAPSAELIVSRRSPLLVYELFRARFPLIASGEVNIFHFVREPGMRAKVSLTTSVEELVADPNLIERVVAFDGGEALKALVSDSGDQEIDVVPAEYEIDRYACGALAPTEITHLCVDEEQHELFLAVPDADAIDRVHLQLAADLVGWGLHVIRGSDHARRKWDAAPVATAKPRGPVPDID